MSKFFPHPKNNFKFDSERGYTCLDGKGDPVFTIRRMGSKVEFTHNKTGKIQIWSANQYDKE